MSDYRFRLVKTSLIDFPGQVAAVLFVEGCNLRCPYCHNPDLVLKRADPGQSYTFSEIMAFLEKRKAVLGGVCVSGGEPLICADLPELVGAIKGLGLKIKIDTNGLFPERLSGLKIDYLAMDIKTSPAKYGRLLPSQTTAFNPGERLAASIKYLREQKIERHFRTTLAPGIVDIDDLKQIIELVRGEPVYYLARYRPNNTLDPNFARVQPYSDDYTRKCQKLFEKAGLTCEIT